MLQLIDIKGQGKDNLDDRMIKQETDFDLYQNRITIIWQEIFKPRYIKEIHWGDYLIQWQEKRDDYDDD